jgi:invasion protein IalB
MNRNRPLRALLIAAFATVAGMAGALAQTAEPAAGGAKLIASGWTLGCRPTGEAQTLLCEASQTITVEQTRQTVLGAFVTPTAAEGAAPFALRFQLPHGLDIPAGVKMLIDDKPAEAPVIQTSGQAGLFARSPLTDTLLAALKKGAMMTVEVTALNGSKLTVPVPLDGFSAVFGKLQ